MKFNESKELASCVTAGNQKCLRPKYGLTPWPWWPCLGWRQWMLIFISKTLCDHELYCSYLPVAKLLIILAVLSAPHQILHTFIEYPQQQGRNTDEANWFSLRRLHNFLLRLDNYSNTWLKSTFTVYFFSSFTHHHLPSFSCFCFISNCHLTQPLQIT